MRWTDVAEAFSWDGSWRDVYVLEADLTVWNKFLGSVPIWSWTYRYSANGEPSALPTTLTDFARQLATSACLEINVGGISLNCHFFAEAQLELDLDPRQVQGQGDLDRLVGFMTRLAQSVGRPAVLTPENLPATAVISVDPERGTLTWHASTPPSPRERVYVSLAGEGVSVWRPVEAERISGNTLRLVAGQPYDRTTEEWQFAPGDIVTCRSRELSEGRALVAVELA